MSMRFSLILSLSLSLIMCISSCSIRSLSLNSCSITRINYEDEFNFEFLHYFPFL